MSLISISNKVAIDPSVVSSIYHADEKGIMILGADLGLLSYIEEPDKEKAEEIIKPFVDAVIKYDKKNKMIRLKGNALLNVDFIAAINSSENRFVINAKDNRILYWLETGSDEEAELICSEVIKAVNAAKNNKRFKIDWDTLTSEI